MHRLRSLWRNVIHRDSVERDLDEELRATIDLLTDENVRAGVPADRARRIARIHIGGVESVKQHVRDARRGALVEALLQDVRYAWRLFVRNPVFAVTAALSLSIGIGATTAMFTVANGLLLRAAAGVSDPTNLVDIVRRDPSRGPGVELMSYPNVIDLRRRATTLDDVYAYQLQLTPASLRLPDGVTPAFTNLTTTNYFRALGVEPAAGRVFDAADSEDPGASPIAVLSYDFWTRRFARDAGVIGRTARINKVPVTIVGVAANGFRGAGILAPDVWLPVSMVEIVSPQGHGEELRNPRIPWLMVGARLKAATRAQASAEVAGIGAELSRNASPGPPASPGPLTLEGVFEIHQGSLVWSAEAASPIPYGVRTLAATFLTLLMALVAVVLVIACTNLAGVLLARATGRRREIAVRAATGAVRSRIVRQLLTETMMLFAVGGLAGLAVARAITKALLLLLPQFPVPPNVSVPLDARVVSFAVVLSWVAAVLAGLAPALHASKTDVVTALKDESQGPLDRLRLRNAFVVAQIAFSILLVVVAGLLVRAFDNAVSVSQGFDARHVDVATLDLTMGAYTDTTGRDVIRRLRERVSTIPGVESVAIADRAPGLGGARSFGSLTVPGATTRSGRSRFTNWMLVQPGFFSTARIPLLAGRDFTEADDHVAELVGIVGQATAKRLWPDRDPIGQVAAITSGTPGDPMLFSLKGTSARDVQIRIVGVVGDVDEGRQGGEAAPLMLYVPLAQKYVPQVSIIARTMPGRATLAQDLRTSVTAVDDNLPVLTVEPLERENSGPVQTQLRIAATVAGIVGLVGVFLAGIGIYGVTAYAVSQRTREIGIRMSLGAGRGDVVRLVLAQGMRLVAAGSAIGLALGLAAGKLISGRQFGVVQADPLVLVGAALLFGVVGLVACYLPVRRASSVTAIEALRYE